jgi:transcriptional coactivator p15 (PC4)
MEPSAESTQDVLVAQFEKNKKEEVRLSVGTFHGRRIINIRVYYKDDDGTWKPGKQGLAVSVERYKDLAGAILQVGEHLQANKLL